MRSFTGVITLSLLVLFVSIGNVVHAQNVLDPNDPVITYNSSAPPTEPAWGQIGKWVRTRRLSWTTTPYKCYIYKGVCFRLKFPTSYNPTANDGKKYPMLVFFHGLGEKGTIYDNEFQLYHGGQFFMNSVTNGTFDGYVIVMQSQGFWGAGHYDYLTEIMDYMVANNKLDPFQVSVNGLSAGGQACWEMMDRYPERVASSLPMSWTSYFYADSPWVSKLKFTPIWNCQGGLDGAPAPATSESVRNAFLNAGGNYKYTLYPDLGHGTWDRFWNEPDFWGYQKRAYASNPWPLFGRTEFCPSDPINATLGVAPGFDGYEWRKDGVLIPGANSNSYTATAIGTYSVRVLLGSLWSEWSRVPIQIKIKGATITPNIVISGLASKVIPSLDGSTSVKLEIPEGYASYDWQKLGNATTISTTRFLAVSTPGDYKVKVTEQFGCSSDFSNPFSVVDANGPNKPDAAINLIATTLSKTSIRLDWSDKPSPQFNETSFEIYVATQTSGPYKYAGSANTDIRKFTVTGLNPNTQYYFKVRAVNNSGAAPASNEATGTTQTDTQAPSAPANLRVTSTTRNTISVQWDAALDDVGVTKYDVYVNGQKSYATTDLKFTISGLQSPNSYNIAVKAKDFAGNVSAFSNQVTGEPLLNGLNYEYYEFNTTLSVLPDFNTLIPDAKGTTANISLTQRARDVNFGFLWEGYINIPTSGTWNIRTNSDDGSRVWLGARNGTGSPYNNSLLQIVNNDGAHGAQNATSSNLNLTAGTYPIAVAYFQGTGGFSMNLLWRQGSASYVNIPNSAFIDNAIVNGTIPNKPSNLVATAISYKRIDLSWTDNGGETAFEIWRSTDPVANFVTIGQVPANTTTYKDSTLNANTKYYYRVRAINQYGESDFDKTGQGIDYSYWEVTNPGSLPSNFSTLGAPIKTGHVNNIGLGMQNRADEFILRFTGVLNIPASKVYTFYLNSDDGSKLYIDGKLVINNDGTHGATELSASKNLTVGSHSIEVQYFDAYVNELLSLQISAAGLSRQNIPESYLGNALTSATTPAGLTAPTAPTGLLAAAQSKTSILVTWTDNATSETKYELFRSATNSSNYILYATLPANTNSFTDNGLFGNSVYYYKIRAVGTGNSAFSSQDSAKTWNTPPVIVQLPATRTAHYDISSSWLIRASDTDGDALTFNGENLPAFVSLINNGNGTATLIVNPTSAQQGVYNNVRINVSDPNGGSDFTQFNLTVNNNYEPVINSITDYTLTENDNINVPLTATDQNASDVITWAVTDLPNAFSLTPGANGSATLNLHPGYGASGSYKVTVTANDGNGGLTTRQFNLTINDKNPNYKVYIRVQYATTIGTPWNSVTTATSTNLKDENGNTTTVGLNFVGGFNTLDRGPVTGSNSGIYPDAVLKDNFVFGAWWMPQTGTAVLTGLDPALKYTFTLYAGTLWDIAPDNGNTNYTVNGQTLSLYVQANTQNAVTFTNITPAADGTITISMSKGTGASAGYLNSIVLSSVYDDGSVPIAPTSLVAQNILGQGVKLSWQNLAYNESGYEVYRATNEAGPFALAGTAQGTDVNNYLDNTVSGKTTYYYKIRAVSASNHSSDFSTVVSILTLNRIPQVNAINSLTLKNNQTSIVNISAVDDPSDLITLTATGLPQFATFIDNGDGTGVVNIQPLLSSIGIYKGIKITATDNSGASSSASFDITVLDKDVQSIYLNFTDGLTEGKPWNNLIGSPNAGTNFTGLKDDRDSSWTSVTVNLQSGFQAVGQVGMRPGNGREIYPVNVVRTGYYDNSTTSKTILISGLSLARKYNFVFFGSHDDGVTDSTNYTVNGSTVTLDGRYNIDKTVQINGVTPNASGQVTITMSKVTANGYMSINAMVIQSYISTTSTFIAPTDLRVIGAKRNSVTLQWQDRSDNEGNFDIYRAPAGGSYGLLNSVSANVTTYTDNTAAANTTYYYLVRARKASAPTTSGYSNVAIGHTYASGIYVNVNSDFQTGPPWNNLATIPQFGYVWNNFTDENNAVTSVGMVESGLWDGLYPNGIVTGNNSGIFPDNVMFESYGLFPGRTASLKLTGLNLTMKYDLTFFASANLGGDVNGAYTINGKTVVLNASMNKSGAVIMYDVVPDEFGEILITITPTLGSQFGLIGAVIVQGYTPAGNIIPTPPARIIATTEEPLKGLAIPDKVSVAAYPNPFDQYFTLTVSTAAPDKLDVLVYDVNGRLVYQNKYGNLNSGINTIRVQPDKGFAAGVYFVKTIVGNSKDLQLIKIIKK
jgi:large repetitive protein